MAISTIIVIILRNLESMLRDLFGLAPRPYKILIELSEHCNSRCLTCSIWKPREGKLNLDLALAEKFFLDYGKNISWLALSGGEISIYPKIFHFIELIKIHCPNLKIVTFTTNGLMPKKTLDIANALRGIGTNVFVTISLDGDEALHDKIRGVPGGYQKAQETFQELKAEGVKTYWGLTISEYNADYFLSRKIDDSAPIFKSITFAHSQGIYLQSNQLHDDKISKVVAKVFDQYRIQSLSELVEWMYLRLSFKYFQNKQTTPIECEALSTNLHLRADGQVQPCMFLPSIYKLADESTLIQVLATKEIRSKIREIKKRHCPQCWMNCYAPHSIMRHPLQSLLQLSGRLS